MIVIGANCILLLEKGAGIYIYGTLFWKESKNLAEVYIYR